MQAITTKYLPATNVRGSRIKASCERGSLIVSYPHELSGEACHRHAVDMLLAKFARENAKKFGSTPEDHHWGKYITGGLGSGQMVHVLLGRRGSALADAGLDADAARDLVSGLVMAEGGAR